MKLSHRTTVLACYNGYVTQAISINLAPLLYLTFQKEFSLSLTEISLLIAFNFSAQLLVDLLATRFSHKLNIRASLVAAHIFSALGLFGLSFFPSMMPPLFGLILASLLLGMGGGFTEVLISPLLEACPTEEKAGSMSLLHSFYCWGQASVALLSVLFFRLSGMENWRILPCLWMIIPLLGVLAFSAVPLYSLPADEGGKKTSLGRLFRMPLFLAFVVMMFCAGGTEMVMSQWASGFAEAALGVSKETGDLLGPCLFALLMGVSRLLHGRFSAKLKLHRLMLAGCIVCISAYLLAAFSPHPAPALLGCALCGFGVGIFWPGLLSRAAATIPGGGISMFAVLALAGDVGCLVAPSVAGRIADAAGDLRMAFVFAILFPLLCFGLLLLQGKLPHPKNGGNHS